MRWFRKMMVTTIHVVRGRYLDGVVRGEYLWLRELGNGRGLAIHSDSDGVPFDVETLGRIRDEIDDMILFIRKTTIREAGVDVE